MYVLRFTANASAGCFKCRMDRPFLFTKDVSSSCRVSIGDGYQITGACELNRIVLDRHSEYQP